MHFVKKFKLQCKKHTLSNCIRRHKLINRIALDLNKTGFEWKMSKLSASNFNKIIG